MNATLPALDRNGKRLTSHDVLRDEHGNQWEVISGWLDGAGTNVSAIRLPRTDPPSRTRLNSARYELVEPKAVAS